MRKNILIILSALICSILLTACKDKSFFIVHGTIEGNPTMNLRYGYNSPEGYRSGIVPVTDGKFEIKGVSDRPALLDMYENDYSFLGNLIAQNGDEITCKLSLGSPEKIVLSGSDFNVEYSKFLNDNADVLRDSIKSVSLIKKYISENPDNLIGSLLLVSHFDARKNPALADSLLSLISPEAKPALIVGSFSYLIGRALPPDGLDAPLDSIRVISRPDSVVTLLPSDQKGLMLVFTESENQRSADSLITILRHAAELPDVRVADIYLSSDTLTWTRVLRHEQQKDDSTPKWLSAWLPGNISSPVLQRLGVNRLPFALVVDSLGQPVYRGASFPRAEEALRELSDTK